MKKIIPFITFIIIVSIAASNLTAQTPHNPRRPKNIILMISDGCGINQIKATNYYHDGFDPAQPYQEFPVVYWMATHLQNGAYNEGNDDRDNGYNSYKAWTEKDYLTKTPTGSAASATAFSTGYLTRIRRIGRDINGKDLQLITERAKDLGKKTGVVTTVPFSHATPACFAAHNDDRGNYAEIARDMLLDSRLDVIMGCGNPKYDDDGKPAEQDYKFVGGEETWEDIFAGKTTFTLADGDGNKTVQDIDSDGTPDPWYLIEDKEDFVSLANAEISPKRVLGVPKVYETLQFNRSGLSTIPNDIPFNRNVPDLSTMSKGALNVLRDSENGFFLMIEGGAVDWACHANNSPRLIEEEHDFNEAVKTVIAWIEDNGGWDENLLIVTGDHETGYLTGPVSGDGAAKAPPIRSEIINNGKGVLPVMTWNSGGHTNQLIPLFAKGAGCEIFAKFRDEVDYMRGPYLHNSEVGQAFFDLWPDSRTAPKPPKNIIVFIADGWGKNQIDAANYYSGKTPRYEEFPIKIAMDTYPAFSKRIKNPDIDKSNMMKGWDVWYNSYLAWSDWEFIANTATGSAPAATAMATGFKSYYRAIGVDLDFNNLQNMTERAKEIGKKAGVVTSVQLSHATPAAWVAHNNYRNNYAALAQETVLDSKVDVVMGCGHPFYDRDGKRKTPGGKDFQYVGGRETWNSLKAGAANYSTLERDNTGRTAPSDNLTVRDVDNDGEPDPWTLIETVDEFRALTSGPTPKRVWGVPQVATTLQFDRGGPKKNAEPFEVPFIKSVPTLKEMTLGAINVLDDSENGFFLMVEGGAVDWAGHDNSSPRLIEEMSGFNDAVEAVIELIDANEAWDETLVIVTGDHECGYLTGSDANPIGWNPVIDNGKGKMPGMTWNSGGHTNQLIPLFAKGSGSEIFLRYADRTDPVWGSYIENSELGTICFDVWGVIPKPVSASE